MPSQKVKGVSSNGIIIVFIARIDDLIGRWLMNYVRVHAGGITLGTGGVQESQVSILVELWVMGPPCGLKVGRAETSCAIMQARHVRG